MKRDDGDRDGYFREVGEFPLLTRKEEVKLAKMIEKGAAAEKRLANNRKKEPAMMKRLERELQAGRQAEQRLICSNLRLVVNRASYYAKYFGLDLSDVICEGNKQLVEFVQRIGRHESGYDWRYGTKFSTYFYLFISQRLQRYCGKNSRLISTSTTVWREKASPKLKAEARRPIISVSSLKNRDSDFDIPDPQSGNSVEDVDCRDEIEAKKEIFNRAVKELLRNQHPAFDERDIKIIHARFGINGYKKPLTLVEIGKLFGITKERARQLEARTIAQIRDKVQSLD